MIIIAYEPVIISVLLLLALISDLKTYKIKNSITYGFMLVGLTLNLAKAGSQGLFFSLQGIMLPAVCLMVLYAMRAVGAGDIKLLSAIGAVMGAGFALHAAACSFIFGGIIAFGIVLFRHNGMGRLKYLLTYIKSCVLSMELLQYTDFEDKQDAGKFHFSIAIASGTTTALIAHRLMSMI